MKIYVLASLVLGIALLGACGGSNTNTNVNANRNTAVVTTPTGTPLAANTDPALKTSIEGELKKKGFNNVTVDVTTTPATLRGTYPKGRLTEVIQTAQVANGNKPLRNEMTEDK